LKNENCRQLKYPDPKIFLIFVPSVGKNDPHIRVPAAFFQAEWTEIRGKNRGCPKAINGHLARSKSVVFWRTGPDSSVFSTGTETTGCAGVSGEDENTKPGNGARIGLIFPRGSDPLISGVSGVG
jgi:hypothetical protein